MLLLTAASQLIVSISILCVWTIRFKIVKEDFQKFKLPNLTRDIVGYTKVVLSIFLLCSLFLHQLAIAVSIFLALFMIAAQYFHWSVKNSFYKRLPSLILLSLLAFIIFSSYITTV